MRQFLDSVSPFVPEPGTFDSNSSSVVNRSALVDEMDALRGQVEQVSDEVRPSTMSTDTAALQS